MNSFNLTIFFTNISPTLLFITLSLTGLILAVIRRKRHPMVSLFAGIFFLGQTINNTTWLVAMILIYYVNKGQDATEFMKSQSTATPAGLLISFIFFIIMLYAIFGWREQKLPPLTEILTQK